MKPFKNLNSLEILRFQEILNQILNDLIKEKQKIENSEKKYKSKKEISIYESKNIYDIATKKDYFICEDNPSFPDTPCWIWVHTFNKYGDPVLCIADPKKRKGKSMINARKHLFQETKERTQLSCCKLINICKEPNCVRPEHVKEVRY